MEEYVLKLDNLVKDYQDKRAVDHVSLALKRGEILGMLGPNGAGKTSTIRMIMNITIPDEGNITILGKPFSEETKDRIGYLPEERGLYRKMKVMDILCFLGELKGMKSQAIRERGRQLLSQFQLADCENKKIEELSKGMAQKVQLIATIIHSPELLILDEPFSGLDPLNIEMVKDMMLEMRKQGISIIFSTHLMEYAEKIVDSVVMINHGKIVLEGRLSEIKARYGQNFAKVGYQGDAGFVAGLPYVKGVKDYGQEMEIELTGQEVRPTLLKELVQRLDVSSFQMTEPSLQHIFIRNVQTEA